jgi:hypothetical protein
MKIQFFLIVVNADSAVKLRWITKKCSKGLKSAYLKIKKRLPYQTASKNSNYSKVLFNSDAQHLHCFSFAFNTNHVKSFCISAQVELM